MNKELNGWYFRKEDRIRDNISIGGSECELELRFHLELAAVTICEGLSILAFEDLDEPFLDTRGLDDFPVEPSATLDSRILLALLDFFRPL